MTTNKLAKIEVYTTRQDTVVTLTLNNLANNIQVYTTRQDTVVTLTLNKLANIEVYTFICCMHISHSSFHALVFGKCISSACLVFFQCSLTAWKMFEAAGALLETFSDLEDELQA